MHERGRGRRKMEERWEGKEVRLDFNRGDRGGRRKGGGEGRGEEGIRG